MTNNGASSILDKAEHVIVLMLENRSFDHFFGYLTLEGRHDIDGLDGKETNPYGGDTFEVFAIDAPQNDGRTPFPLKSAFWPDPIHAHCPTWTQMLNQKQCGVGADGKAISDCPPGPGYQINMEGFALSYVECAPQERNNQPGPIMGHYTQRTLPTFKALTDHFSVVNRWFSSNVGSTVPNRMFSLAGTTAVADHPEGFVDNSQIFAALKAEEIDDRFEHALRARTIFDALTDKGKSWRSYYHNLCVQWLFNDYLTSPCIQHIDNLWKILDGESDEPLSDVTWIDPAYTIEFNTGHPLDTLFGNDDHSPTDIRLGQLLVQTLYEKLVANADLWEKTLLIITYDEHGGFYDHVHPTPTGETAPFQNYGVRVPTLLVSPWVQKQSVVPSDVTFDHTSLIRSLLDRFCDGENLEGQKPNRSDTATSLNVVPALPSLRTDCPRTIDAPPVGMLEKDLLALTDDLESILIGVLRSGISDWQEVLSVLVKLRKIVEGGEPFIHRIVRYILRFFAIKPKEKALRTWRKGELDNQVRRVIAEHGKRLGR